MNRLSRSHLFACAAMVAAAAYLAGSGIAQAGDDASSAPKTAKVGAAAPDFTLKDTDGKEHRLSDYIKQGKIVVLEWFNPTCPFILMHHEKQTTMNDMYKAYKDKNVVILAINSTHSGHEAYGKDADAKKRFKIEFPILLDPEGTVGKMYGAKTTPHMFVIGKGGVLSYAGAMDNDVRGDKPAAEKRNFVVAAIDALLAGKTVVDTDTKPYGCSVKYKG